MSADAYCRKCLCEVCRCNEPNFYCQVKCGSEGFSIEEWNKAYAEIMAMPISEAEKEALLHPEPCKQQCQDCIDIHLDRRLARQYRTVVQ